MRLQNRNKRFVSLCLVLLMSLCFAEGAKAKSVADKVLVSANNKVHEFSYIIKALEVEIVYPPINFNCIVKGESKNKRRETQWLRHYHEHKS
jgi:hypothetical protein